jgi:hypothetical protein
MLAQLRIQKMTIWFHLSAKKLAANTAYAPFSVMWLESGQEG